MSEVKLTIVPTVGLGQPQTNSEAWRLTNWHSSHPWPAGLGDSNVAVIPRKNGKTILAAEMMLNGPLVAIVREPFRFYVEPFLYGFAFLLLLWGCMAWEKWIGWVMR